MLVTWKNQEWGKTEDEPTPSKADAQWEVAWDYRPQFTNHESWISVGPQVRRLFLVDRKLRQQTTKEKQFSDRT